MDWIYLQKLPASITDPIGLTSLCSWSQVSSFLVLVTCDQCIVCAQLKLWLPVRGLEKTAPCSSGIWWFCDQGRSHLESILTKEVSRRTSIRSIHVLHVLHVLGTFAVEQGQAGRRPCVPSAPKRMRHRQYFRTNRFLTASPCFTMLHPADFVCILSKQNKHCKKRLQESFAPLKFCSQVKCKKCFLDLLGLFVSWNVGGYPLSTEV